MPVGKPWSLPISRKEVALERNDSRQYGRIVPQDHSKAVAPPTSDESSPVRRVHLGNIGIAVFLAVIGCGIDLATKSALFTKLGMPGTQPPHWIVPEYFGFETSVNTGGLFGMFHGNTLPLAIISCFAVGGVLWWLTLGGASRDRLLAVILGLILGGILGNLYDRLGLWGVHGVRDWILFRYEQYVWPNFNVADMLLICGAVLMMWHAYRSELAERQEAAEKSTDSATATS